MNAADDIDNALDAIAARVTLGLSCWSWVIDKLPEDDEVTKSIRRQVLSNARVAECSIASLLGGKQ